MYARRVEGRTLTLAVSGLLWQRSLVMVDGETKSLWGQLLGVAMAGPLRGRSLEKVPSSMTDWKTWRRQHPDTTVLMMPRTAKVFVSSMYAKPDRWIVGMVQQGKSRAWPLEELLKQPLANDDVGGTPVVVLFEKSSTTTYAFLRTLGEKTLDFTFADGELLDRQTGSAWDPATGKAISGPLKGKQLKPLVTILSFRKPWKYFHPDSSYWHAG